MESFREAVTTSDEIARVSSISRYHRKDAKGLENELDRIEGMQFDRGWPRVRSRTRAGACSGSAATARPPSPTATMALMSA